MPLSFTGVIHFPRLHERLATHFVPFAEFEKDAAAGTLPDFSLIEPDMASGHNDYHPAYGRSFIGGDLDIGFDPPSSLLGGEAFLQRIYDAYRSMTGPSGTNVWNTALLIGWDEPGGTYDHVPPGPAPRRRRRPAREMGFRFDRLGYRVPAIMVSPWVQPGFGLPRELSAHLVDRHAPQGLGPGRAAHPTRQFGSYLRPGVRPDDAAGPRALGDGAGPASARLDPRRSGRREGAQHLGQGHRSRSDRCGQEHRRGSAFGTLRSRARVTRSCSSSSFERSVFTSSRRWPPRPREGFGGTGLRTYPACAVGGRHRRRRSALGVVDREGMASLPWLPGPTPRSTRIHSSGLVRDAARTIGPGTGRGSGR